MNLTQTVNAAIIHRGKTELPTVQVGSCVSYFWRGKRDSYYSFEPSDYAPFYEKIWYQLDRAIFSHFTSNKSFGLVREIHFKQGKWQAHLIESQFAGLATRLPQNFKNPVSTERLTEQYTEYDPEVESGETVTVTVNTKPTLLERINAAVTKKQLPTTKTVVAQVIAQQSLTATNPIIYLTNREGNEIYTARLSDLPGLEPRIRPEPQHESPETVQPKQVQLKFPQQSASQQIAKQQTQPEEKVEPRQSNAIRPADIAASLSAVVRGQEAATKSIAVAIYDHYVRPASVKKGNVLIVGPTGSGKTELARTASELVDVPFAEVKVSGVSTTGYKGTNLVTAFEDLDRQRQHRSFNRSIVFLDEIDKTTEEHFGEGKGFGGGIQNELIGWVESANIRLENRRTIDTTHMLFVAAGAFVGLKEIIAKRLKKDLSKYSTADQQQLTEELYEQLMGDDLVSYGMKSELVGRFPTITYTKPLSIDLLVDIMKTGKKSAVNQQLHLLQEGYGLQVDVSEAAYRVLAEAASSRGTGARAIETVAMKLFEDIKYNIGELSKGKTALTISGEMAQERLGRLLPNYPRLV